MLIQVDEAKKIFEEIDADEYEKIQEDRRMKDFIVDDDGFGYKDHGGEIWDTSDVREDGAKKKKKKNLDVRLLLLTYFVIALRTVNHKLHGASINSPEEEEHQYGYRHHSSAKAKSD